MSKKIIFVLIFLICSISYFFAYGQDSDKLRFSVMGCAHLGICSFEEFESTIERIKEYKPDFILFLGGMIDPGTDEPLEYLWDKFDSVIVKSGLMCYDIPSSCQITGLLMSGDKKDLMEKFFLARYKQRYYSFEYKNNLFIGLDSESLNQGKGLDFENQLNFLKNVITNTSKYNNIFIFTHEPLWLDNDSAWNKIIHPIINGKVKYVFGAHKHFLEANKIGNVIYITTGIPQCYAMPYLSKISFPNFLIVEVKKGNTDIKIVPINPIPIENLGTLSYLNQAKDKSFNALVKPYRLASHEREILLKPDLVIEALKLKSGMDILDLGAGSGFFTFRFADALKETGRVFATDMDPNMVEIMKNKVKESGYKNVFPVCVESQGVDPFYKQYSFDLIFMCEAYQYLRDPESYFRELRPFLKKEGHLYIINSKNVYDFTEIEIGDFGYFIKTLASKGESFPVFQKLEKDIQSFIKNWKGEEISKEIRKKIVCNLNNMLLDRRLFSDLMDYFASKGLLAGENEWTSPLKLILLKFNYDIRLIKWLYVDLDANGVFDKKEKALTTIDKERLSKLNKILLCGIFEIHRIDTLQGEFSLPVYVKKESIVLTMEKAGYRFVKEYNFLPIHYFLEFKKKLGF